MDQEIKYINIKDLVLWTENPRDPIDKNASDQDIAERAIKDLTGKWSLEKISKEMGDYFDFSELPTVVYHGKKPIVYDGNRRIILAKIKCGLVTIPIEKSLGLPNFPENIPCNICKRNVALKNIFRKHSDSGSWQPLERDIFLHKFMKEEKSLFLLLDENTGIIKTNPHLNQRFVKDEIFKEEILKSIGFTFQEGKLKSVHSDEEAVIILSEISKKIEKKEITTRKNRGKIIEVLEPDIQQLIDQNRNKKPHYTNFRLPYPKDEEYKVRLTPRTNKKGIELFGGKLYLVRGETSDLYRDIVDLYRFYNDNKINLSATFPSLIRMSLRLLCETASKEKKYDKIDLYMKEHYDNARLRLDKNNKTTLSNQTITKDNIVQLLHTGAHNYQASQNMEQTIALSIIIGAILTISHGKA